MKQKGKKKIRRKKQLRQKYLPYQWQVTIPWENLIQAEKKGRQDWKAWLTCPREKQRAGRSGKNWVQDGEEKKKEKKKSFSVSWFFCFLLQVLLWCLPRVELQISKSHLEALLGDPSEQAALLWQSSSACHIPSPHHCKKKRKNSDRYLDKVKKKSPLSSWT